VDGPGVSRAAPRRAAPASALGRGPAERDRGEVARTGDARAEGPEPPKFGAMVSNFSQARREQQRGNLFGGLQRPGALLAPGPPQAESERDRRLRRAAPRPVATLQARPAWRAA